MTRIPISKADEQARLMRERLDLSTAEIGLQVRTTNCLEEKGIFTVRDLLNSRPEVLLTIANFGEKTLEEVYQALERLGYHRPEHKRPRKRGSSAKNDSKSPTTDSSNSMQSIPEAANEPNSFLVS
jgi:DNA-directed RNA polymerase subunit alpha